MAPSSLKKIGAAVACATAVRAAAESYQLSEEYTADNFFDKFDFFVSTYTSGDSWDDTHGYVQYRSQAEAESLGLISASNGQVYIGPDANSTYDPDGKGRDSVRMTSKSTYNQGLMIAKFSHMPVQACGAWPAFWSFADPWLTSGEIDYYEGWNLQGYNRMAMHTNETLAGSCSLTTTNIKGAVETEDCNQLTNGQGCGVNDDSDVWGSTSGATFAMEWTDSAIKIWSWLPGAVPSDITAGSPDTSSGNWGSPSLHVEQTNCDLASSFANQQLVFNIDFCGDTAGSPTFWNASCSAFEDSCASYVANTPSAFAETYFMIEGIQFYEMGVAATPTSSSLAISASVGVTASVDVTASVAVTTSSALVASSSSASASESLLAGPGSVGALSVGVSATPIAETAALAPTVLAETPTYSHSTGYVYATSTATDELGAETMVVVTVDTTICPITASGGAAGPSSAASSSIVEAQTTPATGPAAVQSGSPASGKPITLTSSLALTSHSTQFTTSTVFSTSSSTITSCASAAASCTVGDVTTVVVAVSTTICPVTAAQASGSASSPVVGSSATGAAVPSPSNTSGNSPVQASPAVSSGAASGSTVLSTLRATVTQSSGFALSASGATKTADLTGTEVISATDTEGALMTASSGPTSEAINWGALTETLALATPTGGNAAYNASTATAAAATATQSNTCSGMDCIVVSNGAVKTSTVGVSGVALALLAGAMFLF